MSSRLAALYSPLLKTADSLVVGSPPSIQLVKEDSKMAKYLPSQSSQAFGPATVRRAVVRLARQRLKEGGKGKSLKSNKQGKIELG